MKVEKWLSYKSAIATPSVFNMLPHSQSAFPPLSWGSCHSLELILEIHVLQVFCCCCFWYWGTHNFVLTGRLLCPWARPWPPPVLYYMPFPPPSLLLSLPCSKFLASNDHLHQSPKQLGLRMCNTVLSCLHFWQSLVQWVYIVLVCGLWSAYLCIH